MTLQNKIIKIDCIEGMSKISSDSIDTIVAKLKSENSF